ncbi:hypothetical protein [Hymenobacter convexus]|uniref:hypothetical protein n=1 Tax=Hymenobacter sp. CA1UV-4 TaxID=3063782 RepID=UPI002712DBE4|nr:hypothetical protein [Hymenobacter sp. CA1UV-4]MDO7851439.1 hypothetical protein [Hymenobacter sp. CA1UV-4]
MPTTPFKPQPTNLLALLLGGALVLSLGLNGVLLTARPEPWPDDDDALAATTADLHLTQRLLAQCQQHQLRQDSLRTHTASAALADHQPDFSSAQ